MPQKKNSGSNANLMVNIYSGKRKFVGKSTEVLIRIIDGNQNEQQAKYLKGPSHYFTNLPVFQNFGDNYTVVVSAKGYKQAGFTPIKIAKGVGQHIDLMIVPKKGSYDFNRATWEALKTSSPFIHDLLRSGAKSEAAARERYDLLRKDEPDIVASFLNILTAMGSIYLPEGTPLDYIKQIIWREMKQDRFFVYSDKELLAQVERAADQQQWTPEIASAIFHPGATKSFKQVQFGEANVQLTFHENDAKWIKGIECVKIEADIDYHRDIAAHALLEVIPNTLTGQKSDPKAIYVLRWIAGRKAGVPEFDPPYAIV